MRATIMKVGVFVMIVAALFEIWLTIPALACFVIAIFAPKEKP